MRLKELRKKSKLRQQDVADAINCSQAVYSRYENGEREPSKDVLRSLADYFGVTVDYIIGREDNATKPDTHQQAEELQKENAAMLSSLTPEEWQRVVDFIAGMRAGKD